MDSQVTLVAPSPPLSILFNSYSLRNAHISLSTVPSKALYTVHTTPLSPSGNTTLYICTGDQTLVVVQQNEMFPDQITFHEENGVKRKVSVSKWLKKATLPDHWPVRIMTLNESSYYWKSDRRYRLALYNVHDHDNPILTYTVESPISIIIHAEHEQVLSHAPDILAAFIIQENKMRSGERYNEVATGIGQMGAGIRSRWARS